MRYEVWIRRDDSGQVDEDYIIDSTHKSWTVAVQEASRLRRAYRGSCSKAVEVSHDLDGNEVRRTI